MQRSATTSPFFYPDESKNRSITARAIKEHLKAMATHCNTHVLIILSRHISQLLSCYSSTVVVGWWIRGGDGGGKHGDTVMVVVVVVPTSDLLLHACLDGRMGGVEWGRY